MGKGIFYICKKPPNKLEQFPLQFTNEAVHSIFHKKF